MLDIAATHTVVTLVVEYPADFSDSPYEHYWFLCARSLQNHVSLYESCELINFAIDSLDERSTRLKVYRASASLFSVGDVLRYASRGRIFALKALYLTP